jgi:DtxR family Mn-dependent transcriptional regulator
MVAEELEHVSSRKLIDRLDQFLGFPQFDPHGDPIPDIKGKMTYPSVITLDEWPVQQAATVCQVRNQSSEILEHLKSKHIQPGTMLEVRKRFSFDQSVEVKVKGTLTTLSQQLAKMIIVKRT